MRHFVLIPILAFCLLAGGACQPADDDGATTVTLLFTNDVESAYDPIPAFWIDDQEMIGGILRKDLPGGDIRAVDLLGAYPFVDDVIVKELSGEQIRRALVQSLTLERGLLQLAGLRVAHDQSRPERERLVSVEHDGSPLADDQRLAVAAPGFLAEGGDLYTVFAESDALRSAGKVTDVVTGYLARRDVVAVPSGGRQVDVARGDRPAGGPMTGPDGAAAGAIPGSSATAGNP